MIQEVIFGVGQLILALSLFPTLIAEEKPALSTSLITGFILFLFGVAFVSTGMVYATTTSVIASVIWFTLAFQKVQHDHS